MTDRTPGKPGQYKATVTSAELEKLQSGKQFVITLVRDDQPTAEGTPYNKESVLPDELAAVICPDITDPTPADALEGLLPRNGGSAMTGNLKMGGYGIKNLADPSERADAAHKWYVDKLAYHENYLDNSDFSNPVNQRGEATYTTGKAYAIDRWYNYNGLSVEISDGCIVLTNTGTANRYIYQNIKRAQKLAGKYVWFAVCLEDGTVYTVAATLPANDVTVVTTINTGVRGDGLILGLYKTTDQYIQARLTLRNGKTVSLKWAMLYEAQTVPSSTSLADDVSNLVPDYYPKGYGAELMECMRYYQVRSTGDVAAVDMRPPMVSDTPEITEVANGFAYSADI